MVDRYQLIGSLPRRRLVPLAERLEAVMSRVLESPENLL
jgi:hypothetical protein